jgi:uncharacterized protein (TIGR02270 family)
LILESIIRQHAEEAAFLWVLRDISIRRSHLSLDSLTDLDYRVDAHLDGLLVAGEAGWEICRKALGEGEAGELFAASCLAFESGRDDRIRAVLAFSNKDRGLSRGIVSALGWLSYPRVEGHIRQLLSDDSTALRLIGLAASTAHRRDPGRSLNDALTDPDLLLKAHALRAIGRLGRKDLLPYIMDFRESEDPLCRFNAAWSGAMLGDGASADTLMEFAGTDAPWAEEAVMTALGRMPLAAALEWQKELTQKPDTFRVSVVGAGMIGDPCLVPWLIERMSVPELARIAGEAFSMITGADISACLEGKPPEGFESGPTENPEDEDVGIDPDGDLPWPDPEAIPAWWGKNRARFRPGTRYLAGEPMTVENLQHVLKTGYQCRRRAAAMALSKINPGEPLFEVRAPGFRQKQLLGVR